MTVFTWTPEFGAQGDVTPNVSKQQFGDGYQQRQAKGLNPISESWPVAFANRESAEGAAILAFLTARGGVEAFTWTTPEGNSIVVVCSKWSKLLVKGSRWTITAQFDQVFEP
ncbi:MAG: phage tail protein [Bdellovibrionales bacterium]